MYNWKSLEWNFPPRKIFLLQAYSGLASTPATIEIAPVQEKCVQKPKGMRV